MEAKSYRQLFEILIFFFSNWECFCFCILASTIFGVDLICLSHAATRTLTLDTPDRRVAQWGQKFYEFTMRTNLLNSSDEPELEFSGSSRAEL